ncbi:MAG TPA: DUF4194 domain-containing protein [Gammaproteobacteria bacterium]|jgi:hypothetical protein|nr:DUF4194 domain-containing protein [Gammaproteobacteria bacterium]
MTTPDILSLVTIHLLKGVLYHDKHPELWQGLLNVQGAVRDYIAVIGLELLIDETEGFAFLRQNEIAEGDVQASALPRLVQRRQLNYYVSLLCVLLRKKLIENDTTGGSSRLIINQQQIVNMMMVYLPERSNEIKTAEQIEVCINKMLELGFLRRLKNSNDHYYEIQRIIKAFVDADWLQRIDEKLQEYQAYAQSNTE